MHGDLPATAALARTAVKHGQEATLRLRVDDAVSPRATVVVKIAGGSAMKGTLKLGWRATNSTILCRFVCGLAPGAYTWKVHATDLAGNAPDQGRGAGARGQVGR